mmetsp:Transcript_52611/g.59533  ORF Transcript_52611/g.59533 Transcript_52611/m.59533 type:complete len:480 (+) Transcript_52611:93-1532(+)
MKVPTKHGLDRKFKPWRKGKSSNSKKRTSLKQQMRGHERLLARILSKEKDPKQKKQEDQSEQQGQKVQELKIKIEELKQEISEKQQSMIEKKNAEDSHGQRFLDRQRLVRQEKKIRKIEQESEKETQEDQLGKLALDQVYVAHHPNDIKYMSLFKHGKRVVDQSRHLFRRAVTRKRILRDLADSSLISTKSKVTWISIDQYERLPKDWTIQDEEKVFGGSISRSSNKNNTKKTKEDARFTIAPNHEMLLKAAEQAKSDLRQEDEKGKGKVPKKIVGEKLVGKAGRQVSKCDSSSSSDDEEADPLSSKATNEKRKQQGKKSSKNNFDPTDNDKKEEARPLSSLKEKNRIKIKQEEDSSCDIDESETDQKPLGAKHKKQTHIEDSSDSDSDSASISSDTSSSDDDKTPPSQINKHGTIKTEDFETKEVDDFLVDATDDHNVFEKPSTTIPALSTVRGDKSRGFETQSQRPDEYKKKRIRRY